MRILLIFISVLSQLSFSSDYGKVLEVDESGLELIITHKGTNSWKVNDEVCIKRETKILACGKVIKVTDIAAQVVITLTSKENILIGDYVVDKNEKNRDLSAKNEPEPIIQDVSENDTKAYSLTFGIYTLSPFIQYEYPIFEKYSLELATIYETNTIFSKIRGFGIFGGFSYYPYKLYEKFFIELNWGLSRICSLISEKEVTSPLFYVLLGWRSKISLKMHYNIGIGTKYFIYWDLVERSSSGLYPIFNLSLSYEF